MSVAWELLKRFWWLIPATGLLIYAAIQHTEARHWEKVAEQTDQAFKQTVAGYRIAAEEAARLDKANVERVKKEQATITERVTHDYENKLADSSSRYDRLRAKASGYLSSTSPTSLPASPDTTCEAVAGTKCKNIPTLLKAAQDNTDQLLALQDWVRSQSNVNNQ